MDSPASCVESPAIPAIKQIRRMLHFSTEDLMEQVNDFTVFVEELKDYTWRLTNKESLFLECVLRFQKELAADVPFIHLVEEAEYCHKEVVAAVFNQTWLVKEGMRVQEEILAISFNEEEKIDG
ncbi:hypothetical protein A2U01_0018512 [Trifolium medium]|uniref:Uncharacterized protein n=1 Tax=Trifolium medium TaxID=97028 RepID=A0A392NCC7_9FABA|nr:hypothetical protein [Trifolium medium]